MCKSCRRLSTEVWGRNCTGAEGGDVPTTVAVGLVQIQKYSCEISNKINRKNSIQFFNYTLLISWEESLREIGSQTQHYTKGMMYKVQSVIK